MNLPDLAYYIAPVIGLVTLLIGIFAVIKPAQMSKKFGVVASGHSLPYVISTGIRDVFMGLVVLSLFYLQNWKALGVSIFCITIVAISDFLVVQKYGDKKTSLIHLGGAIAVSLYGTWMFVNSY